MNLHLIYASEYLQCFCLDIHYKSEKTNIILNALSWLASHEYQLESDESSLDVLHSSSVSIYVNTLIKMSFKFHQCILDRYIKKSHWQWVIDMIQHNDVLNSSNATTLPYVCIWGLLYYKDIEKKHQLCISTYLYEEVFVLAHNFMNHFRYVHMHERLTDNLYLSDLSKHLYEYIHHCSHCQLMQTSRHSSYEFMQSIFTSLWSFHILTIDFILILPASGSPDNYNIIFSVTDKFSKTVIFISEQKIMTVKNWAISLMNHLILLNWDLSWVILSDQDHKFIITL